MPDVDIWVLAHRDPVITRQRMDAARGQVADWVESIRRAVDQARSAAGLTTYPRWSGRVTANLHQPLDLGSRTMAVFQIRIKTNPDLDASAILRECITILVTESQWTSSRNFHSLLGSLEIVIEANRVCGVQATWPNGPAGERRLKLWNDQNDN